MERGVIISLDLDCQNSWPCAGAKSGMNQACKGQQSFHRASCLLQNRSANQSPNNRIDNAPGADKALANPSNFVWKNAVQSSYRGHLGDLHNHHSLKGNFVFQARLFPTAHWYKKDRKVATLCFSECHGEFRFTFSICVICDASFSGASQSGKPCPAFSVQKEDSQGNFIRSLDHLLLPQANQEISGSDACQFIGKLQKPSRSIRQRFNRGPRWLLISIRPGSDLTKALV